MQEDKNMNRLAGKVAVVTGSTDGIGLAIARRLGREGASVVVSSRKSENVERTVSELKGQGITVAGSVCNVSNAEQRESLVQTAVEKFGKIDILVNNAGINPAYGSLLDVPESIWDKLFNTNVKASYLLSRLAIPHMEKAGGGSILYVSSIAGYQPMPGIMAYGVTKTALLGLTKAMAETVAGMNIRVNCLAPGLIKTEFSRALWDNPGPEAVAQVNALVPMGRLGTADECASAAAFLVSEDASYVTGETLLVGGGVRARL